MVLLECVKKTFGRGSLDHESACHFMKNDTMIEHHNLHTPIKTIDGRSTFFTNPGQSTNNFSKSEPASVHQDIPSVVTTEDVDDDDISLISLERSLRTMAIADRPLTPIRPRKLSFNQVRKSRPFKKSQSQKLSHCRSAIADWPSDEEEETSLINPIDMEKSDTYFNPCSVSNGVDVSRKQIISSLTANCNDIRNHIHEPYECTFQSSYSPTFTEEFCLHQNNEIMESREPPSTASPMRWTHYLP